MIKTHTINGVPFSLKAVKEMTKTQFLDVVKSQKKPNREGGKPNFPESLNGEKAYDTLITAHTKWQEELTANK